MFESLVNRHLLPLRFRWSVLFAWIISAVLIPAYAMGEDEEVESYYVLRDGSKVRMIRSESEVGVVFRRGGDMERAKQRFAIQERGTVESIKGAANARIKLFRASDNTKAPLRQRSIVFERNEDVEALYPVYRFKGLDAPMIGNRLVNVKVRSGLSEQEIEKLWADYQIVVRGAATGLPDVYRVALLDDDDDAVHVAELLADDDRTVWAQPDLHRPRQRRQVVPDDEYYQEQWHLNNTGQSGGTADADIDAPEAWLSSEGQGVLLGMFDDSCDVDHEDLQGNYIGIGHDPTVPSDSAGADDPRPKILGDRHGTGVMGLVAARANSVGVRGVAYLANFTASRGLGDLISDFEIASVYTFARQQDVDVHINSWGLEGGFNATVIEDAIQTAFEEGREFGDEKLGMVVVFASGNEGVELQSGEDYSTLDAVIGVGATTDRDQLASFSNYGVNIDILAPGGSGSDQGGVGLTTTDNEDMVGRPDNGNNIAGDNFPDPEGKYYEAFGGTSAACPIVAGVAALAISKNPLLTATEVRVILLHTADQIAPEAAQYHPITSRSERYGYGRVNAQRAVEATEQTLINGGFTWPARPYRVQVSGNQLRWTSSAGTDEFLVVVSDNEFGFIPEDGVCYDARQIGCGSLPLTPLPSGVQVLDVFNQNECCDIGAISTLSFTTAADELKYFGLYGRNSIGRYGFGVSILSDGQVLGAGPVVPVPTNPDDQENPLPPDPPPPPPSEEGPRVSIQASPLEGRSPLTIQFRGNAVSEHPIDEDRTVWVFGDGSNNVVGRRTTEKEYTANPGQRITYVAQLTMFDIKDNSGSGTVNITVEGPEDDSIGVIGSGDLVINISTPGGASTDVVEGTSPFSVELSLRVSDLPGPPQSVTWDLGNGDMANGLFVLHTFTNTTPETQVIPVTATVIVSTSGAQTQRLTATRLVTVLPGGSQTTGPDPNFRPDPPTGSRGTCGAMGIMALLGCLTGVMFLRRSRF